MDNAMILPINAYTDQNWFNKEQKQLFGQVWQFIGIEKDLPEPGYYETKTINNHPIIILRTEQGKLKAFHNLCRHRGMPLLGGSGITPKMITCPYHCWTYQTHTGDLKSIPEERLFPNVKKEETGLKPVKIDTYQGLVFVNPNPSGESLQEFLAGIDELYGHLNPNELEEVSELIYEVKCNWKLLVENYIDAYHLRYLHNETLADFDLKNQTNLSINKHNLTHQSYKEQPDSGFFNSLLQDWKPIDNYPKEHYGSFTHMLFPNIGIIETEQSWSYFHIIPITGNHTRIVLRNWLAPSIWNDKKVHLTIYNGFTGERNRLEDSAPKQAKHLRGHPMLDELDVMLEDIYVCEKIQQSMYSSQFSVADYATEGEDVIKNFQKNVLEFIKP